MNSTDFIGLPVLDQVRCLLIGDVEILGSFHFQNLTSGGLPGQLKPIW